MSEFESANGFPTELTSEGVNLFAEAGALIILANIKGYGRGRLRVCKAGSEDNGGFEEGD